MSKFLTDLRRGKRAEELVVKIINDVGFDCYIDNSVKYEWDVIIIYGKYNIPIEVKFDEYEQRSGNIAIEVFNTRLGKQSGLTATKAFFWAHVLCDGVVWITTVEKLKKYLDTEPPSRIIDSGGDGNATLHLYNSTQILSDIFVRIDNAPDHVIQDFIISSWGLIHE